MVLSSGETQQESVNGAQNGHEPIEGETLPVLNDLSPIGGRNAVFYPIYDEDVSGMNDDILQMQIHLGEVQERNIKRRIEYKRRKIANASQQSEDSLLGLSRDLSREIDRERASQLPQALERIQVLERDNALWAERLRKEREETLNTARAQVQSEMDAYSKELQMVMTKNAEIIRAEAEQRHSTVMVAANAEGSATIAAITEEHKLQIAEVQSLHETRLRETEMNALTNHDSEVRELREHLQKASDTIRHEEFQMVELRASSREMEEHIRLMTDEYRAANATVAMAKPNSDTLLLRHQLGKIQDEHRVETQNLKAQYNQIDVQYRKLKETLDTEHAQEIAKMKGEEHSSHLVAFTEAKRSHALIVKDLHAEVDQCKGTMSAYEGEIRELKQKLKDCMNDVSKRDSTINKLNVDIQKLSDEYAKQVSDLRGEIQALKKDIGNLPTTQAATSTHHDPAPNGSSSSNQRPDPQTKDQDETYEYGDDDEEYYEEDYDEEYYEEEAEDCGGEVEDIKSMYKQIMEFKQMMTFMSQAANATTEPKGKEADTVKIPQLPTAAQFKSWKNAVRSAVSSASRTPAEAFEWVMTVEQAETTYESLSVCPKIFDTLDAKLSSALTQICKGELGRKITLKTEEEAKARKLIKGRQILWIIYQEYRVSEEAGSLNDITDLMKVTMKKDFTKVEHLARFLLNWETVLAGINDPPPDNQLQVMFYDQVRHVPSISNDIAMYDRADPDSAERSYQFLMKAVQRVLQRTKRERNRKDIEKSLDNLTNGTINTVKGGKGGKGGKAGKGKGNPKGKGKGDFGGGNTRDNNCREWMASQTCRRGKTCIYDHPTIQGWKFVAGAKAKAKPRPKGEGKGNKTKVLCKYFAAGHCRNGDKCNDLHEGSLAPVRDNTAAAKAKAKAKAGAKPVESGNV
jgi:hypothetical protein